MASKTRDARIIAAVACPLCGACVGEQCRNPIPHQQSRGAVDRRAQPMHPHRERRDDWVRIKSELDKDVRFLYRNAIENLHVSPARTFRFIVDDFYDGKPPSNLRWVLGVQG